MHFKSISLKELLDMINNYIHNPSPSTESIIIWFDNMEVEILEFSPHDDPSGLGQALSNSNRSISNAITCGELHTSFNNIEKERNYSAEESPEIPLNVPSFFIRTKDDILPKTRLFIFSPFLCPEPEEYVKSLTEIETLNSKLNIPFIIFLKSEWEKQLPAISKNYKEYTCVERQDDKKSKWMERVSHNNKYGFQYLDNFYLDFLRQAPNDFISYNIGSGKTYVDTFCSFGRWEYTGYHFFNAIYSIITMGNPWGAKPTKNQIKNLQSSYRDGNLDLKALSQVLDSLQEDLWKDWVKSNQFSLKNNPHLNNASKRIEYVITYLCYDLFLVGNILPAAQKALLEFNLNKLSSNDC